MFRVFNSKPPPAVDDSDGEEATFTCRICFEEDCKPSELIAPCQCKGTLKYVHQSCLHKWQTNVQKLGGKKDERARICGVCRTRYTSVPPTAAAHTLLKVWSCAKSLMGASCIALLALCLSGPPLLHLLLLAVLLLGSRSQSVLVILIMMFGGVMASLYARGLRLVLRKEGDMRVGIALIRHGAPVDGLRVGSLLVAHDNSLDETFFAQSVVLLTEMNSRGAKGVLITQPIDSIESGHLLSHHQLSEGLITSGHIQHFLGGPVGLPPHSGAAGQSVVLHHQATVQGAAAVLLEATAETGLEETQQQQQMQVQVQRRPQRQQRWCLRWAQFCVKHEPQQRRQQQQGAAAAAELGHSMRGSSSSSRGADVGLPLYQGGSLENILQAVQQHNAGTAAAAAAGLHRGSLATKLRHLNRGSAHQQQQRAARLADDAAALKAVVRMYHGICVWSAGQLEGEVRAGAWGLVSQADVSDIVITAPQILWQQLLHSNRTQWL